jgi:hypothetical protein
MFVAAGRAGIMRSIASPSTQIIDATTLRGLLSP